MSEILVQCQSLVAGWGKPATPAFDLVLRAGEIVGLTGPNGIGKSTLLSAIAGRARVFSGRLEIRAGLQLALQTQDVPPLEGLPLSGRELLAMTGAEARALPVWLADRLDWRLDRLSGGQRHYLALWAVMMAPANVILLDEPTNNLDAAGSTHLSQIVRQLAGEGRTILLVSHDADFVAAACDRVQHLETTDVV